MRLPIELVPKTCWGNNLRKLLSTKDWNMLSTFVRESKDYTCEMCGTKQDNTIQLYTHCHEVWRYNEDTYTQELDRFECLCPDCHAVHHWGHSQITGRDMQKLNEHACRVNHCSKAEWEQHIITKTTRFLVRSRYDWTLDTKGIL